MLSLDWLYLCWSLINVPLLSSLYSCHPLSLFLSLCLFLSTHLLYQWHVAAMLRSGHKVAVGDIVKVTNGQHLPADMVIVSSRSDSACMCVYVRVSNK